jgi:hypothetical protein
VEQPFVGYVESGLYVADFSGKTTSSALVLLVRKVMQFPRRPYEGWVLAYTDPKSYLL